MHRNRGRTVAQCLHDRTEYAKNPDKTDEYELISAYGCDPHTADAEFLFSKRQYQAMTGREQKSDVIAYQIRQSFRPGEVTPEEANRIGYELASRFLKGKHAFLVCTHADKKHIHSHIIFNSTSLDCKRKFRDFLGSGRAVARLSDIICLEHGLSVIEHPKRHSHSGYDRWLGEKAKPSKRGMLRGVIDGILEKKPKDFGEFLALLVEAGYTIKPGKHTAVIPPGEKRAIRFDSLGDGYTEEALRAVLAGTQDHKPRGARKQNAPSGHSLLIDIDAKLREGKGTGYAQWAKLYNLKQMAMTVNYLKEHGLLDYAELERKTAEASERFHALADRIKAAEKRMAEITVLRTQIINYMKTREVFAAYKKTRYSRKFLAEHESEIILHRAAKKVFDQMGVKKLPTVKSLQTEYAALLADKKSAYAEYRQAREEMRELAVHKANVEEILGADLTRGEKKKEQRLE